jgi:hypothetical protein
MTGSNRLHQFGGCGLVAEPCVSAAPLRRSMQLFAQFRISEALMATYKLVWDDLCSWYLESDQARVRGRRR